MEDEPQLSTARETLRYVWQFFHDRLIHRDLWPALSMCIEAQGYHFQHLL
jgi:hypothetical protein